MRSLRGHLVSTEVQIVTLAAARQRADDLWEGFSQVGAQWSSRQRHVSQLHTLCCQLLVELAGRNARTVAIDRVEVDRDREFAVETGGVQ